MSGCDRELNAHCYSADSAWHQVTETSQSHLIYTDTGQSGVTILTLKIRVQSVEQIIPFLTTLVCCGPGSNLVSSELGADTLPTAILRW